MTSALARLLWALSLLLPPTSTCSTRREMIVRVQFSQSSSTGADKLRLAPPPRTVAQVHEAVLAKYGAQYSVELASPLKSNTRQADLSDLDADVSGLRLLFAYLTPAHSSSEGTLLAIAGPLFSTSNLTLCGHAVQLSERRATRLTEVDGCTGDHSWDGAVVLAKYLEMHPELVRGKAVLELGAGTGVAGLGALAAGAESVLCTDLPYALHSLGANLALNACLGAGVGSARAAHLDWFEPTTYPSPPQRRDGGQGWDVLLGADVVWLDHLVAPLVRALVALSGPHSLLLLSYQSRSEQTTDSLFRLLAAHFAMEKVSIAFREACIALTPT